MNKKIIFQTNSIILLSCFTLLACQTNQTPLARSFAESGGSVVSDANDLDQPIPQGSFTPAVPSQQSRAIPPTLGRQANQETRLEKHEATYENRPLPNITANRAGYASNGFYPGIIQVVLRGENTLRLETATMRARPRFKSNITTDAERLNTILNKFQATVASDLSTGLTEAEVETDHQQMRAAFSGEVPSRRQVMYISFPENTNLHALIQELRRESGIRTANLVPQAAPAAWSKTSLSSLQVNVGTPTKGIAPSDNGFKNNPESVWWWYNRHQVFKGWEQYKSSTGTTPSMPTIAVIDSGFDIDAAAYNFDMPNYLQGLAITDCTAVGLANCQVNANYGAVQEPITSATLGSHGSQVSTIISAGRDNTNNFAGVAPGAEIYPIRVMKPNPSDQYDDYYGPFIIPTAIREASFLANVDVINLSITADNFCPLSAADDVVRTEIRSAIARGKIVVVATGNKLVNQQNLSTIAPSCGTTTGGEIVVGGIETDNLVSPPRIAGWIFGSNGSNYDSTASLVDIAAGAEQIQTYYYIRRTNQRFYDYAEGTSMATPMVAATVGMMKEVALANGVSFTTADLHRQIKSVLLASADMGRYTAGYTTKKEEKFLGENLFRTTSPFPAIPMIGVKSLNVNNAITIARNLGRYNMIARLHNSDDKAWLTVNNDWSSGTHIVDDMGKDTIWGINGLVPGDFLTFFNQNTTVGGVAWGLQVIKNKERVFSTMNGVSGITGIEENAPKPIDFYAGTTYSF